MLYLRATKAVKGRLSELPTVLALTGTDGFMETRLRQVGTFT